MDGVSRYQEGNPHHHLVVGHRAGHLPRLGPQPVRSGTRVRGHAEGALNSIFGRGPELDDSSHRAWGPSHHSLTLATSNVLPSSGPEKAT